MLINFKPVGVIKTSATEDEVRQKGGEIEGEIEIATEFEAALDGLEEYSHLFVICYFDRLRPEQIGPLKVKPKRLASKGYSLGELPLLGVFALDSPSRPNPIGLTLVRLRRREGRRLLVTGLDYFDGTPVLDVKGYRPEYRVEAFTLPSWYASFMDVKGHI